MITEYTPDSLELRMLPRPDPQSGNPCFVFEKDYTFKIFGRAADFATFPKGRDTDGGSIPSWLQSFAQPWSYRMRIAFIRHDLKYTIQGGRRCWIGNELATIAYTAQYISKLRADGELAWDIVVADVVGRWLDLFYPDSTCPTPQWYDFVVLTFITPFLLLRAFLIGLAVMFLGSKAWKSIEPGTAPSKAPTP